MRRLLTPFALALVLGTGLVPAASAAPDNALTDLSSVEPSATAGTAADKDICVGDRVPKKQVIIREWWWSACGSQQPPYPPTAYTIRKPNPGGEYVCLLRLPKQFVLTSDKHRSSACYGDGGSEGWNQLFVQKAQPGMAVCVNSPIPPRWSHGTSFASSSCRIDFAWTITPPPSP